MPILIKSIEGSIISYFNNSGEDADYVGSVNLINPMVGQVGVETYINIPNFEGLVQDFSSAIQGEFFDTLPTTYGYLGCTTQTEVNLSI